MGDHVWGSEEGKRAICRQQGGMEVSSGTSEPLQSHGL